jgi:hypothetical protein
MIITAEYYGPTSQVRDRKLRKAGNYTELGSGFDFTLFMRDFSWERKTEKGIKTLISKLKKFRWLKVKRGYYHC